MSKLPCLAHVFLSNIAPPQLQWYVKNLLAGKSIFKRQPKTVPASLFNKKALPRALMFEKILTWLIGKTW